jgi:group I intron endonuclease
MTTKTVGIYRITNILNGKCYIGQSVNVYARWNRHKQMARLERPTAHLYRAMQKYGFENFKFEILEILQERDSVKLNDLEIYYIKLFHSFEDDSQGGGYNETMGGDSHTVSDDTLKRMKTAQQNRPPVSDATRELHRKSMLENPVFKGKHHSEEALFKIRKAQEIYWSKPESRQAASKRSRGRVSPNRGKHLSVEAIRKNRESHLGQVPINKGKKVSSEVIQRQKRSIKQRYKEKAEKYYEMIKNYDKTVLGWIAQASRETGLSKAKIRLVCKKMGILFRTKGTYTSKTGTINDDWKVLEPYNKTHFGWIIKASKETGMSCKHIMAVCNKVGVEWRTRRNDV